MGERLIVMARADRRHHPRPEGDRMNSWLLPHIRLQPGLIKAFQKHLVSNRSIN